MTICTKIPHLSSSGTVADSIRCNKARAHWRGGAVVYILNSDGTVATGAGWLPKVSCRDLTESLSNESLPTVVFQEMKPLTDWLKKVHREYEQIEEDLGYLEKRTIIKSKFRKSPEGDDYHALTLGLELVTTDSTFICAENWNWHPQQHVTASRETKQRSTFSRVAQS